jgi:hypothetical protein
MALVTVTAKDLNRLIEQRKLERSAVFNAIFEMVTKKIVKYANNERFRCVFEVPDFVLGHPLYNITDALKYLINRLRNDCKLHVKYYFPKVLYISWDMEEVNGKTIVAPLLVQSKTPVFIAMDEAKQRELAERELREQRKQFGNPHAYDDDAILDPEGEYDIHQRLLELSRTKRHVKPQIVQMQKEEDHQTEDEQRQQRQPIPPPRQTVVDPFRFSAGPKVSFAQSPSFAGESGLFPPLPVSCKSVRRPALPPPPHPSPPARRRSGTPSRQGRQTTTHTNNAVRQQQTVNKALNFRKLSEFTPSGKFVLNLT